MRDRRSLHRFASRRDLMIGMTLWAATGAIGRAAAGDGEVRQDVLAGTARRSGTRFRPYSWADALKRCEIMTAEVSARGQIALVITRPLQADGPHYERPRPAVVSRGELWLCNADLSSMRKLDLDGRWVWAPAFSPDGAWLAALTTRGDGRVGLAIWNVSTGRARLHDRFNVDIYGRFRTIDREDQAVLSFWQSPLQFIWADNDCLLFVAAAQDETQFDLAGPSSAATFERLRSRAFHGAAAVRTWSADGETCFVGRKLMSLDRATGSTAAIHTGDIRGVSLSPDTQWVAMLKAGRHIGIDPAARQGAPLRYTGPADDPMVACSLSAVRLKDGATFEVQDFAAIGNAAPSRLPLWSWDSRRIAIATRLSYSSEAATGDDACWEVDVTTRRARHWPATSAADAEFMANLVAADDGGDTEKLLRQRQPVSDPPMGAGGQIRARFWNLPSGAVIKWVGDALCLLRDGEESVLADECSAVASPVPLSGGGQIIVAQQNGGGFAAITISDGRYQTMPLDLPAKAVLLSAGSDGRVLCKQDADDGSRIFIASPGRPAVASPMILNRHLSEVRQAPVREVVRASSDGNRLVGILQTPTNRRDGEKSPVIVWAYPNSIPSVTSGISQINSPYAVAYPFQHLLAQGFAVFQAPLPMADQPDEVDPLDYVASLITPWLDVLDQQPDVAAGQYGFWGHSDAGFAALALEATTDRFRAIAAASTFPDLAATVYSANLSIQTLNCAGDILQSNRFYYEADDQHYRVGASLWKNPDGWLRNSALYRLGNAVTPMLLMVGEYDAAPRSLEEVYSVLRGKGVSAELAYYWGEGHVIMSRGNLHDLWTRSEMFFRRHLKS